ncbi:MAG: hypothetical protein KKC68_05520 [Candidatus Thermoplasmatota archaeon]|nr:hypothetical protein [Candidatus Thermoplasmatota archaeon]MBU1941214.1 hypothetical protein [Candidatus Thermoplasmatota archaeon]
MKRVSSVWCAVFGLVLVCSLGVVDTGFSVPIVGSPQGTVTWYVGGSGPGNYNPYSGCRG